MRAGVSAQRSSKSQIVNFRLSPEEYSALREASHAGGARNIGSFARSIVLLWVERRKERTDSLQDDIDLLRARFIDLDLAFREFVNRRLQTNQPNLPPTMIHPQSKGFRDADI